MDRHGSPVLDFVEVRHPPEEAAGHKEQRESDLGNEPLTVPGLLMFRKLWVLCTHPPNRSVRSSYSEY